MQLSRSGAFTLLAVACLTIMVGCVIVPGLPSIAAQLGVGSAASWLVTLPSLGVILFGPLAGRLIERLGLYRSLCLGLFAYGLLGVAAAILHGPVVVFVDRLLLGGATAVVMAAGTGLLSVFYEGQARLAMIARQGMAIELGGVIFLFIGGLLATLGWRWPFLLYLSAWVFLGMVLLFIPRPAEALDEDTAPAAPVPKALKAVFGFAALSMIIFFTGVILLPLSLHGIGLDEAQVGYFLSFVSLVAVVAAALMPRLNAHLGAHGTLLLAFAFYTSAYALFGFASSLGWLILGATCMGLGFGFSIPLVNHLTLEQSTPRQRGKHLAYLSMAIFGGQFLSSFMEWMPGEPAAVFRWAGVLGVMGMGWAVWVRGALGREMSGSHSARG